MYVYIGDAMSHFSKRLELLARPSFFWYVTSCLLSTFASGISYVTMSWLILQADNSVSAISLLMLCFWLPTIVLGPFFGVVADRYSRKWLIILGNALRGLVLVGFGGYFHYHISAPLMYLLMLMLGMSFSVYFPAGIALIREIVPAKDLLYANSTVDIAFETGNVVGMGMAGFIIALSSSAVTIFVSGFIFLISTLAMFRVVVTRKSPVTRLKKSFMQDFYLGFQYLQENKKLLIIYCVQLLILVAFMTAPVLLAPLAKNVLHTTVLQFGQIEAALSIGVITGGFMMPWIVERVGFYRMLIILCSMMAICFAWFSANQYVTGAAVLYLFLGVSLSVWPLIVTEAQNITKLDFQARVQSVFNSISGILILAMYLLVDLGSHFISIRRMYGLEVLIALIAILLLIRFRSLIKVRVE